MSLWLVLGLRQAELPLPLRASCALSGLPMPFRAFSPSVRALRVPEGLRLWLSGGN